MTKSLSQLPGFNKRLKENHISLVKLGKKMVEAQKALYKASD